MVLLDVASGKVLQRFDLSTNDLVPSSFPYTGVATRDGRRAWCSLWNASRVAELDLTSGKVIRWIKLQEPDDPIAPGSHPTAMLLSPDEKIAVRGIVECRCGRGDRNRTRSRCHLISSLRGQEQNTAGTYPIALAESADGKLLFVADASLNAVAVFDTLI